MISDATFAGALQVPPSGEPILLMADRQTTGGYPQIAVVITADLPLAGQLVPGDWCEFEMCSMRPTRGAALMRRGERRAVRRRDAAALAASRTCRWPPFRRSVSAARRRGFCDRAHAGRRRVGMRSGASAMALPLFVLGGGSNLVIADEGVQRLVLQMAHRGHDVRRAMLATRCVRAGAGESWDAVVAATVDARARRPGVSLGHSGHRRRHADSERRRVRAGSGRHDRHAWTCSIGARAELVTLAADECGFAYRMSRFKREDAGRFIVCGVTLRLRAGAADGHVSGCAGRTGERAASWRPRVADVRDAVLAIRRRKGMVVDAADPDTAASARFS